MYDYVFRRALRYWAETLHESRGRASEVRKNIFEATSHKVKGHPEVKLP